MAEEDKQAAEPAELSVLDVHPDNRRAYDLFLAAMPHFKLVLGFMGGARWLSVQPCDLRQLMDWLGVRRRDQQDLWWRYTTMEREALRILNERQEEAQRKNQG